MTSTSKNLLERMAKASSWLLFDRVFRLFVGFVVGILVARHYGPSQWGALNYVIACVVLLGSMTSTGSENLIMRDLAKCGSEQGRTDIQKTAMVLRFGFGIFSYLTLLILVFATQGIGLPLYLAMAYGLVFIFQFSEVWEYRLRIEHHLPIIAKTHIVASTFSSALKLISLILGWPLIAIAIAMAAEYALNLIFLARYCLRYWSDFLGTFDRQYARNLIKASSLVMLGGFLMACQSRSEYYLIAHFMNLESLGIYAAALKCMEVVDALILVFTMTIMPELVKRQQLELPILARRTYLLGMVFFVVMLFFMAFMYLIYPWVYGEQYLAAQAIIPWLALRPLFVILGAIRGIFLVMEGRLRYLPICSAVGLGVTVLLSSLLIPSWGLQGAAISGLMGLMISNFAIDLLFRPSNITNIFLCYREWPYALDRLMQILKIKKSMSNADLS